MTQQIAADASLSRYTSSTPIGASGAEFVLHLQTDPGTTNFDVPGGSVFVMYAVDFGAFVLAKYDNSGWSVMVSGGTAWTPLTATASDVLVASVVLDGGGRATATNLAGSARMFEGVQEGYRSGDITVTADVEPGTTVGDVHYETVTIDVYATGFKPYFTASNNTLYIFGTGIGDSSPALFSNDLLRSVIYADSNNTWADVAGTGSDTYNRVEYTYDRQGETATLKDQNGTTHAYVYDGIGHELSDTITAFGPGIDDSVVSLAFAYKVCGRFLSAESLNASGDVVNEVLDHYDSNGDLDKVYQEHGVNGSGGAVGTSTSEYVAYGYDDSTSTGYDGALGTTVTIAAAGFRPTTLQYPTSGTSDSRVITDSYGTTGEMNDQINQLDSIIDGTGTFGSPPTTGDTIDTVAHLGDGTLTGETYNLPSTTISYNLLGTTTIGGVATPNLDQFNRVQNMVWSKYGTDPSTLDGFEYLRDTKGDVTQRINAVDAVFSEMYSNDKLDQVETLTRGTISDGAIASPTFTEEFSPDGFGNQSSYQQTVAGSTTVDQTSTFGPTNQVQDFSGGGWATPSFDAAGNATATPNPLAPTTGLNIEVDGWNNVTHLSNTSDSINVSYFYDALGNMIVRVNNLTASDEVSTTDIYYSGQQVLEEDPRLPTGPASDAAAVAHQYVYSPRSVNTPILDTLTTYTVASGAWTSATSTYYFLTDDNDNVTAVTNASGAVQETLRLFCFWHHDNLQ